MVPGNRSASEHQRDVALNVYTHAPTGVLPLSHPVPWGFVLGYNARAQGPGSEHLVKPEHTYDLASSQT
jgi:hypothetical protein